MLNRMAQPSDLIGSRESCRILNKDKATLSRWVQNGTLTPAAKLPGKNGAYLFHRKDVEALAANRGREAS